MGISSQNRSGKENDKIERWLILQGDSLAPHLSLATSIAGHQVTWGGENTNDQVDQRFKNGQVSRDPREGTVIFILRLSGHAERF